MSNEPKPLPRARRRDELVLTELPDEVLVYDTRRHAAHCLSKAAVIVWRHCDGQSTADRAREELAHAGLGDGAEIVDLAVEQLAAAHLLEAKVSEDILVRSRRRALKQMALIGGTALALPLVQSIIAPTSAEACTSNNGVIGDSCGPSQCCQWGITCCGGTCCSDTQCCGTTCCSTGTFCDSAKGSCCPTGKFRTGAACPPGQDVCCGGVCPPEGTCL